MAKLFEITLIYNLASVELISEEVKRETRNTNAVGRGTSKLG